MSEIKSIELYNKLIAIYPAQEVRHVMSQCLIGRGIIHSPWAFSVAIQAACDDCFFAMSDKTKAKEWIELQEWIEEHEQYLDYLDNLATDLLFRARK